MRGTNDFARTGSEADLVIERTKREMAPTLAVQELKHAATVFVPSGQQGQGVGSSAAGIESAHGISELAVALAAAIAIAAGANDSACAATSTYIRARIRRGFTRPNICLWEWDRHFSRPFPG